MSQAEYEQSLTVKKINHGDVISRDVINRDVISRKTQNGFTLIEVLIVVFIIGLLAAVVSVNIGGAQEKSIKTRLQQDYSTLSTALKMYRLDNSRYPSELQSLEALVQLTEVQPIPRVWPEGGYLDSLPADPWGSPYIYRVDKGKFELMSYGADKLPGGTGPDQDIQLNSLAIHSL